MSKIVNDCQMDYMIEIICFFGFTWYSILYLFFCAVTMALTFFANNTYRDRKINAQEQFIMVMFYFIVATRHVQPCIP